MVFKTLGQKSKGHFSTQRVMTASRIDETINFSHVLILLPLFDKVSAANVKKEQTGFSLKLTSLQMEKCPLRSLQHNNNLPACHDYGLGKNSSSVWQHSHVPCQRSGHCNKNGQKFYCVVARSFQLFPRCRGENQASIMRNNERMRQVLARDCR